MRKRILLVEDDKDLQRNMRNLLEGEGFEVDVAENGQIGLEILRKSEIRHCLIILDIMMPGMDGQQFHDVQSRDPSIAGVPILIMSAAGQIEERRKKMGAFAALKKPADIDSILKVVEQACN